MNTSLIGVVNVDLNDFEIKELVDMHRSIAKRHSDISWTQKKISERNPVYTFGDMKTKEDWESSSNYHDYKRRIHLKRARFLKRLIK